MPRSDRACRLASSSVALVLSLVLVAGNATAGESCADANVQVSSREQMMGWIRSLVVGGIRRPGFWADARAELWIAGKLRRFGVQGVHLEPIQVERWREGRCHLDVRIDGGSPVSVPCFPVPFSSPVEGLTAPAVRDRLDAAGDPAELVGKIAVYDNAHTAFPAALLRDFVATGSYDPDGDFDDLIQRLPFGPRVLEVMDPAEAAGAVGFIGIVGQSWESRFYYTPYDALSRGIPGVWIAPADGAWLLGEMEAGRTVDATMSYRARQTTTRDHNVIGVLPGASDEWVIIGTHHDAPWLGAVEDGSGVALVLAQARYWSRVPRAERPYNLLFLFNGGHMSGGAGIAHFVENHRPVIDRSRVAIHLEHVAREARVVDGRLEPGDAPTPRWWFTSRIPELEKAVLGVIEGADLRRSLLLPPDAFFENPPTDGAFLHPAGVPIVQLLAAPEYLVDIGDTPRMVHEESLVPITCSVIQLIHTAPPRPPRTDAVDPGTSTAD